MDAERLRATVADLEQQLRGMPTVDAPTRRALEDALQEIRSALNQRPAEATTQPKLIDRLTEALGKFEGAHPDFTVSVGRLIDGLAQMGI